MSPKDAENLRAGSTGRGPISESEIRALEEMEDERLRRCGIDPDGDPIEIMMEIRRQAREMERKKRRRGKADPSPAKQRPRSG